MAHSDDSDDLEEATRSETERQLARRVARSFDRDAITAAIVAVGIALEPDGQFDPADDPRPEAAVRHLAQLIEDPLVAEAVALAVSALWHQWVLGDDA